MSIKGSIQGFSKLSKKEKIAWVVDQYLNGDTQASEVLSQHWNVDEKMQQTFDGFSENTLSNYHLPYGIAPNFLINNQWYAVPMVTEESSVVAAASSAAKYWSKRGGIQTKVLGVEKKGQVSFTWSGGHSTLKEHFPQIRTELLKGIQLIESNMQKRGGGVKDVVLLYLGEQLHDVYQLKATFDTCDSMGANFINTCLEQFASTLSNYAQANLADQGRLEVIMSILSNYTDNCVVEARVSCPIDELKVNNDRINHKNLANKFKKAVDIACHDSYRAVTHNKGIFNGIDAVVLATGNDFRAVEACGHAYASRTGKYRSLSECTIHEDQFTFTLTLPLAIGTVGGLTSLHPLAKMSLNILGKPNAKELMQIIAATGLAQNFAAVKSLVTTGIQQGHMKMHLQNIFNQLGADDEEKAYLNEHLDTSKVSHSAVRQLLDAYRTESSSNV